MLKPEELALDDVKPNAGVLRKVDEQIVSELAKSIQFNGLLQPILVRRLNSAFEVVFGHHRLEACKRLGLKSISAVVTSLSTDDSFLTQVVENLQRNTEINPLAEAKGYISLIDHGWTINAIASRIGKSDSYVSDRIGLIRRLHPMIARRMLDNNKGHLKPSHCELLARLRSKRSQLELSDMVEQKRLSVRKLEKMISGGQPVKETVEERAGSLYVQLPRGIVERMQIEAGESVYVYLQSNKRIAIERAGVRTSELEQDEISVTIPND